MGRIVFLLASVASPALAGPGASNSAAAFDAFVSKFGRVYKDEAERQQRFEIFKQHLEAIEAENAGQEDFRLAINDFADLTPEEFGASHLGLSGPPRWGGLKLEPQQSAVEPPSSVDWVSEGAVTTPKNQGQCGGCWSFSTTGALEGAWEIKTGKLESFSEQQLIDCSKGGNNGCGGGNMDTAFEYLETVGLCAEESYPYTAKDGFCGASTCTPVLPAGAIKGFVDVPQYNQAALTQAVALQPVSVGVQAGNTAFQMYSSGVLTSSNCGGALDHAVLVVGYSSTLTGVKYWKVKNSWGTAWGEGGFIRLERGHGHQGQCGILSMASYPVLSSEAVVV